MNDAPTLDESAPTLDDIGNLVRILALTTRDDQRAGTNLVQPALLQQLRTNIVPDGDGGLSGRGKLANERSPINAAALTLYEFLTRRIGDLYTQATGRAPYGSPEELLVAWYIALAVDNADDPLIQNQLDNLHTRLDDYRTRIMDLFHPPEGAEISHPCPECDWRHVARETPEGTIRQAALVGWHRPWKNEHGIRCRNCNTTWIGEPAMRALAADLGIEPAELEEKPAEPAPVDRAPLHLLAMTYEQAKAWARENDVPLKLVQLASAPDARLRKTHRPVIITRHDAYAPGPHEAGRVAEAIRTAALVNTMNGYQPDGTAKPLEEN
ncbi:hypothetical protein AB0870_08245 [Microbacterium proteolyticum]|uniref:hypothetical protein n=1 Tax=Microbacterium proteolyticum TaxID=1572644 RepID=UPI00345C0A9C